jgi:hypothetical protein
MLVRPLYQRHPGFGKVRTATGRDAHIKTWQDLLRELEPTLMLKRTPTRDAYGSG